MASVAIPRPAVPPLHATLSRTERHHLAERYIAWALIVFAVPLIGASRWQRRVATPSRRHHRQRPLLGIRGTPGRLALAVFRTPLWLYRRGWGWLLGRTFLMLVHVGRKTGQRHDMVAMILADNRATGEVVIFSGWGPDVDWLSNLRAGPAAEVRIARERFVPEHRFLSEDEAVAVIAAFRRRHPGRVRLATAILGWGDLRSDAALRDFVRGHPFVALHPTATGPPTSTPEMEAEA